MRSRDVQTEMVSVSLSNRPQKNATPKPPKAPCWRDFVPQDKSKGAKALTTGASLCRDLKLPHRSASEGNDSPRISRTSQGSKLGSPETPDGCSKHQRRIRCKLHRTDSHVSLGNLPRIENTTVSLADTHPCEIGISGSDGPLDEQMYLEDNTKRCEEWLETVQASRPFATDWDFFQGSGDEIEIPEETWMELGQVGYTQKRQKVRKKSGLALTSKSSSEKPGNPQARAHKSQKDNRLPPACQSPSACNIYNQTVRSRPNLRNHGKSVAKS